MGEDSKKCVVKVEMTEEEKAELEKFAKEYGYSVSDTIRYALGHFYETEPIRKEIAAVSPLGYCHRLQSRIDDRKKDDLKKNEHVYIVKRNYNGDSMDFVFRHKKDAEKCAERLKENCPDEEITCAKYVIREDYR